MCREESKEILILDSSAIINGYNPASSSKKHLISEKTIKEVKDQKSRRILETAISIKKVKIAKASEKSIQKTRKNAEKTGDLKYLSEADIETIAIALDAKEKGLQPIIITDDFTIQNVLSHMKIPYKPVITSGIKNKVKWIIYCPACGATYTDKKISTCEICGSKLKRKIKS
ncbi:MAG: ribonuclease VapC [archaeon GB-1867-035]|nr:ribonuclease VapC [Candidatus Culexmicrobium profundum]